MSDTPFQLSNNGARRVLLVGAHSDDIEIGCGGTVLRLIAMAPQMEFLWLVLSGDGVRADEAKASAATFLHGCARSTVTVLGFRDGFFPYSGEAIKEEFEALKDFEPDIVFTHFRDDRHQDHRLVSDLTWNTFRRATVLEYEIPKYDGDLGSPNVFATLDAAHATAKVSTIRRCFESQVSRDWFHEDVFWSLLRLRGMECRSASGYAEAFYGRKITF